MEGKHVVDDGALLDMKADELVLMLQTGVIDPDTVKALRQKINIALDQASLPKKIEAFQHIDTGADRLEMLNSFEELLAQHQLDTRASKKYITHERAKRAVVLVVGLLLIALGMAMIIMPQPDYFEMYTLFYFNDNDGVTVMDVISLLIAFTGVYLLLTAVLKKRGT